MVLSKTLPRLLTGFSVIDGIWMPPREKQDSSVIFPHFNSSALDYAGLNYICSQSLKALEDPSTSRH